MDGLKVGAFVAHVGRWAHSQASDRSPAQIAEDIAEHILGDDYLKMLRAHDQSRGGSVHIEILCLNLREFPGYPGKNLAKEIEASQDVALFHQSHSPSPVFGGPPGLVPGQLESKATDSLASLAG